MSPTAAAPILVNKEPACRTRFDEGRNGLLDEMVWMGIVCNEMLQTAFDALTTQDRGRIATVIQQDNALDAQAQRIETNAYRLLTLQQPVLAADLRFVGMALRAGTDLERIGDQCVNIARLAERMSADGVLFQPLIDVQRMKRLVAVMLSDTVTALVRQDTALARRVMAADDEVDVLYREMQRQLRDRLLTSNGNDVLRASHLLFVAHYLERIGDHCVGIAERIIFVETGQYAPELLLDDRA